jgi:MFS transporter, PPP family, 3-phenylpropionic acid transporter
MRQNRAHLYTGFYLTQFLFLGVQLPFFPGWLDAKGFSEAEIGWLTGGALIMRLLLGAGIAWWAEGLRDQRLVLRLVAGLMFFSSAMLLMTDSKMALAILAMLMLFSFGCLVPLTDTAVLRADRQGLLTYGKARGFGSFAFIFANLVGGVVIAQHGDNAGVWWIVGATFATLLVSFIVPRINPVGNLDRLKEIKPESTTAIRPPKLAEAGRLIKSPSFLLLLLASGMVQGAHATYYTFSELHWSRLGYGSDLIGVLWTIGVACEIFLLYNAKRLLQITGPVGMILLGAIAALIRWPLIGLSPPLYVLVFLQGLHAFTFAATYMGTVEFIARAVPGNLTNTAMTLVSTLGVGAVTGVAAILAGFIFSPAAPFAAYGMMGAMGGVGIIAALLLQRRWHGGLLRTDR